MPVRSLTSVKVSRSERAGSAADGFADFFLPPVLLRGRPRFLMFSFLISSKTSSESAG